MRRLLLLFFLLLPTFAWAHSPDQLPFVKLNGQDAGIYPVGTSSIPGLVLPQDLALSPLLVTQPLQAQIDTVNLPILPENLPKATFHWDFGDGKKIDGINVAHTYSKIGSYTITLTLSIQDETTEPQLLDLIMLNVIPYANYTLPTASFTVNGNTTTDVYKTRLPFNFKNSLQFVSASKAGSASISHYLWDFGDQQSSQNSSTTHQYDNVLSYAQPLLRVTDSNGFISDTLLQLENSNFTGAVPLAGTATPVAHSSQAKSIALGAIILVGCGLLFGLKRARR